MHWSGVSLVLVSVLSLVAPASADMIFSDEASFLGAVTGPLRFEDFEGLPNTVAGPIIDLPGLAFDISAPGNSSVRLRDTPVSGLHNTHGAETFVHWVTGDIAPFEIVFTFAAPAISGRR